MDATIAYDTVVGLLANPPSLGSRPNFFNLRELHLHYARALKKVSCPQSAINGWSGAVQSPAMYALIDTTAFQWNISTTTIPEFPARFVQEDDGTNGAKIPYTREEILTISATHARPDIIFWSSRRNVADIAMRLHLRGEYSYICFRDTIAVLNSGWK